MNYNRYILLLSLLYAGVFTDLTFPQAKDEIFLHEKGKRIERTISGSEIHPYGLKLNSGESADLMVIQKEADVRITVVGPSSDTIETINRAAGIRPSEPWNNSNREYATISATSSGTYHLLVQLVDPTALASNYEIHIMDLLTPAEIARYKEDANVRWLGEHAMPVRSIEAEDEDFSDLEPLQNILGKARVVMLGEQTHGDGSTFKAKIRLIKFLHERLGYDVLAFEGSLYGIGKAWQLIMHGEDPTRAVEGSIKTWSSTAEFNPLIRYIGDKAKSEHPLEIAGFDVRLRGTPSKDFLLPDLENMLRSYHVRNYVDGPDSTFLINMRYLISYYFTDHDSLFSDSNRVSLFSNQLGRVVETLTARNVQRQDSQLSFLLQNLKSIRHVVDAIRERKPTQTPSDAEYQVRDEQMGENLLWLAQSYYPEKKIIVWAATMHCIRYPPLIDTRIPGFSYEGYRVMGDLLWQALRDEVYVVGFTAYEGDCGNPKWRSPPIKIIRNQDDALEIEEMLNYAGFDYAFLDLRNLPEDGSWLKQGQLCRPLGNLTMAAPWNKVLDGLFFIRQMKPATKR